MCEKRRERILTTKYNKVKYRHKLLKERKGIVFSKKDNDRYYDDFITIKEFELLSFKKCFYCDEESSVVWKDISSTRGVVYEVSDLTINANGLDRIDNDKEYQLGNILTCCKECNRMRGTLTQAQFYIRLRKIFMKLGKKLFKNLYNKITSS